LFFEKRKNKFYLDLAVSNRKIAEENGISSIKIHDKCTICNENYFSYRRDNTSKRHLAYIGIRKE
jgi:copper oxidase (laccase) domain-containing protein